MMNVGVIGCGKQASKHVCALKKLNVERIAVCDIQPGMAAELAGRLEVVPYESIEGMLGDQSIDVVDICTPTPFHFQYARQALLAGKHVICEKPLTASVDEAEQLQELVLRHNRQGMVTYVFKYHPRFVRAKEIVDAGIIGPLRAIYMRLGGKGSHRAWKHQSESGGGAVNEMMSHMLDLLLWFMGDVSEVEAVNMDNIVRKRRIDGQEVDTYAEDFAIVAGKGVNGTKFVIQSDLISQIYTNQIDLIGEEGYIKLSIVDSDESHVYLNEGRPPLNQGKNPLVFPATDLFHAMFTDFFQSIQNQGRIEKNSFQDALKLAQLIFRVNRLALGHEASRPHRASRLAEKAGKLSRDKYKILIPGRSNGLAQAGVA